jgi:hypothetical protein
MSHQTETTETDETRRVAPAPAPGRAPDRARPLELIACDGCGRHFTTDDGPGMIAMIKGPCPDCGGHFELIDASSEDRLL